ncbi:MAG: hypothetical protein CFH34_01000 [Alphaproteobacteria bacterium MarineAlpha9_Bin4]|nr:MAG: hypothetical protein CFH34_01000 [Alphaproteobacteria bacterium MarineAlpha9_Bin4]
MAWWYYIIIWFISFGIPISCFQWFLSDRYNLNGETLDSNQMLRFLSIYIATMIFATLVCILIAILFGIPS